MKSTVILTRCTTYDSPEVEAAVRRTIDLLGGMARFVRPGERILLKPNLLSARVPERGVTTHPEIVRAMVRLVKEAGATPIIGDSPGGAVKGVERVWNETGMKKIAQEEGVELVNFETAGALEKKIRHPYVDSLHVSKVPLEADGIINLPKLKTHGVMIFTGGIKNFYGCIPGLRKAEYHKMAPHPDDFGLLLAELYLLLKPKVRLTLIDGIVGMEGNGPSSGELRTMNLLLAGTDALALDTAATHLCGFAPQKIPMIRHLARLGGGASSMKDITLSGDAPENFDFTHFKFPSNWYVNLVPRFLVRFLGRFLWMKPAIVPEICANCAMCMNSCPVNAIHRKPGQKPVVDTKACISCLCCHELCTYHAVELKSSVLAKRLIRQ